MLDPFSALGLASNIVQFVDFGSKLISESHEIYNSAAGGSVGHVELETIYGNLHEISHKLNASTSPLAATRKRPSKEVEALRKLASGCKDVADELLSTLQKLKVDTSNDRKWQSFRQALLNVWNKQKVEALQRRLDGFSRQLTLQFASLIQDQQLEILKGIANLDSDSRRLFSEQKNQLGELGKKLGKTLDGIGTDPSSSQVDQVVAELLETVSMASEVSTEQQILRSLHFQSLRARHAKISNTYQETFEWVFEPTSRTSVDKCSEIKLLDWLRSQMGIYWVSGNPGSGKSTLMKYLSDHPATEEALKIWARGKQLITAKFFFWNAGSDIQKSYEGLLRSILYEVLRRCPDLIQSVCAARWQMIEHNQVSHGWDISELSQMFDKLVQEESMSSRFCFFIDGLDEYEGDHYEMIQDFNILCKSSHIKICLSSRPWDIFEDAFGQDTDRKLYLQDLTRGDIELYVRNNLESHRALADLAPEDKAQYQTVIDEIVEKSKGVFLWVFLVVRSLYDGLTNGDTVSGLESRLRSLPADLEKFFQHIIDQVDKKYQPDMARTFQEALQAGEPLTLLAYSYLDEPGDFAVGLSIATIDESRVNSRVSMMRRRINARCKGLMEIDIVPLAPYFSAHRVDFLHRTVRDFLLTREMQQLLDRYMDKSINVHRSLCRANLALAKTMPEDYSLQTLVDNVLEHSRKAELATGVSDHRVLDELERTYEFRSRDSMAHGLDGTSDYRELPLFNLALNKGLHIYIREKLDVETPAQIKNARLLLGRWLLPIRGSEDQPAAWATWLLSIAEDYDSDEHFDIRLKTLTMLLREGADPNRRHLDGTIIDALLEWLHSVRKDPKTEAETIYLFNIVATLIKHGATPNLCSFQGRTRVLKDPKLPLEETFDQFPSDLAANLLKRTQPMVGSTQPTQTRFKHRFRFWLRS